MLLRRNPLQKKTSTRDLLGCTSGCVFPKKYKFSPTLIRAVFAINMKRIIPAGNYLGVLTEQVVSSVCIFVLFSFLSEIERDGNSRPRPQKGTHLT